MQTPYELPIPGDWQKANIQSLEFIQNKADDRLSNTVDYFNRLYGRIFVYISLLTPVIAALIYAMVGEVSAPAGGSDPLVIWVGMPVLVVSLYALWLLIQAQRTYRYYSPGMVPSELAQPHYLGVDKEYGLDTPTQYLSLLKGYTETLQTAIESNESVCAGMQKQLTRVLYLMFFALLATVVVLSVFAVVRAGL